MKKEEYIEYLQSFSNKEIDKAITHYRNNIINFHKLEGIALNNHCMSMFVYYRFFKIGNILRNLNNE